MEILIVDDFPANRMLMEKLVRNVFGCDVVIAGNGKEALEKLTLRTVDVILLDLKMPQMSGVEFLTILRKTDAWKAIPVIVITGEHDRAVVKETVALGVSSYLLKPFAAEDVIDRINEVLEMRKEKPS